MVYTGVSWQAKDCKSKHHLKITEVTGSYHPCFNISRKVSDSLYKIIVLYRTERDDMARYSVNISKESYGYNVSVWDEKNQMYPVAYNNKFIGYNIREIKDMIRKKYNLQRKHIFWYGSALGVNLYSD